MKANLPVIGGVGRIAKVDESVRSRNNHHGGRRVRRNIYGGRGTAGTDQLPVLIYHHTSLTSTVTIEKISRIYKFYSISYVNIFLKLP